MRKQTDDKDIGRGAKHLVCPLHRKPMYRVCHNCPLWGQYIGTDKNTGETVHDYYCSLFMLPKLLMENNSEIRGLGAATESFRNVVDKLGKVYATNGVMIDVTNEGKQKRLEPNQTVRRLAHSKE